MKTLELVGLGALAYLGAGMVVDKAYNNVDWNVGQIDTNWTQSARGIVTITACINITNKNPIAISVQTVRGIVTYGNIKLTDLNLPIAAVLEPHQPKAVPVIFTVNFYSVLQDALASLGQNGVLGTILKKLHFKGDVITSIITIPIEMDIPVA